MISLYWLLLLPRVVGWGAPLYEGFTLCWQDDFSGQAGELPDENRWHIVNGALGVNNELEVYTRSSRNVQLSGGNTLQLVPWYDGHGWTSGRVESTYTFTPKRGTVTRVEALIRFGSGDSSRQKGIWPAWWLLGDSIRRGTGWPGCGEIDIMETVNGELTGHGTLHCHVSPGGICNEGTGITSNVKFDNRGWYTWRLDLDLSPSDWSQQKILWFLNGQQFHAVSGAQINNQLVWSSLTASPLFLILNVAVGGNWPGYPDQDTLDGYQSMMEVAYAAHYERAS
ncbi:hypothetical protein PWT90_10145 [Aphanocladium album]|nr:hypothetical protein PWT90_10145 [Aphanocladium album]